MPAARLPENGFIEGSLTVLAGLPFASVRFTVTLARLIAFMVPLVTLMVSCAAGPEISPLPCAVALIGLDDTILADTLLPKLAVDASDTGEAVGISRAATVEWMEPGCEAPVAAVGAADDADDIFAPAAGLDAEGLVFDELADDEPDALLAEPVTVVLALAWSAASLCDPEQAVAKTKVAANVPPKARRAVPERLNERARSCIEPATILTALRLTADSPESSPDE